MRKHHRALISLGSNIEREKNLPQAVKFLEQHPDVRVERVSSVYDTDAVGPEPQPRFSNAAVLVWTSLTPGELRDALRQLEAEMGRVRSADKYAPRPIDLDLILYDDYVGKVGAAPLPDPDLVHYPHIAVPAAEIAPDWRHPVSGEPLAAIARRVVQGRGGVQLVVVDQGARCNKSSD